jgi:serine/threonine protein kinase
MTTHFNSNVDDSSLILPERKDSAPKLTTTLSLSSAGRGGRRAQTTTSSSSSSTVISSSHQEDDETTDTNDTVTEEDDIKDKKKQQQYLDSWSLQRARTSLPKLETIKSVNYLQRKLTLFRTSPQFEQLRTSNPNETVLEYSHSDIELAGLMGRGAFSNVFSIKNMQGQPDSKNVVVKVLRPQLLEKPSLFRACALGLLREGLILSQLSHPHVLALHGTGSQQYFPNGCNDDHFLVLGKLNGGMLDARLSHWKQQKITIQYFTIRQRRMKMAQLFQQQLTAARDLASAVAYLHSRRVLHRDLKPANVGFLLENGQERLQLFDFDVATVLPVPSNGEETFKLTAKIGTRRYMSPECGLSEAYGLASDVFSFGILLHQLLSLQTPFDHIQTRKEHSRRVFIAGERPPIRYREEHYWWRTEICNALRASWKRDPRLRPTMNGMHQILQQRVYEMSLQYPSHNGEVEKVASKKLPTNSSPKAAVRVVPSQ